MKKKINYPSIVDCLTSTRLNNVLAQVDIGIDGCIALVAINNIGDEKIERLAALYADDPERSLEELCSEVELNPSKFLGMTAAALYESGLDVSKLIVSTYNPLMVKRAIQQALSDDGQAELIEFLRAAGVFLSPKGSKVNTKKSIPLNSNYDYGLPKFEDTLALGEKAIRDSQAIECPTLERE